MSTILRGEKKVAISMPNIAASVLDRSYCNSNIITDTNTVNLIFTS